MTALSRCPSLQLERERATAFACGAAVILPKTDASACGAAAQAAEVASVEGRRGRGWRPRRWRDEGGGGGCESVGGRERCPELPAAQDRFYSLRRAFLAGSCAARSRIWPGPCAMSFCELNKALSRGAPSLLSRMLAGSSSFVCFSRPRSRKCLSLHVDGRVMQSFCFVRVCSRSCRFFHRLRWRRLMGLGGDCGTGGGRGR